MVSASFLSIGTASTWAKVPTPDDVGGSGGFGGVASQEQAKYDIEEGAYKDEANKAFTDASSLHNVVVGINCFILGCFEDSSSESGASSTGAGGNIFLDDASEVTPKRQLGAIGDVNRLTSQFFSNPPARTDLYIADVLNSAGIGVAPPAYAQGIGFASLSPILDAWKAMRNLTYFFFVLVFLFIGFLIMLRHRIGGQTAITAQQAIPRIIISLLAVTFSYAIVGLLIDSMYLLMFAMIGVFGSNTNLISMNIFELGTLLITNGASTMYDVVYNFVDSLANSLGLGLYGALGTLGGITISAVVAVALLFGIFKLFFELLQTYVHLLVSIVLSPLLLMMGAIPGRNVFGNWVKSIIGNLSAFPTTLLVLLIYDKMTGGLSGIAPRTANETGFMPPYLIGTGSGDVVRFLIGFGVIMIIGDIVKQAKSSLGAGKGPFDVFAQNLIEATKKGWEGGRLMPGVDTTNLPFGGLSGKNVLRKGAMAAGSVAGGVMGGVGDIAARIPAYTPWVRSRHIPGTQATSRQAQASVHEYMTDARDTSIIDSSRAGAKRTSTFVGRLLRDPSVWKPPEKKK